jgi:hypothetical protein
VVCCQVAAVERVVVVGEGADEEVTGGGVDDFVEGCHDGRRTLCWWFWFGVVPRMQAVAGGRWVSERGEARAKVLMRRKEVPLSGKMSEVEG